MSININTELARFLLPCCILLAASGCGAEDAESDPTGFVYNNQIFRDTALIQAARSGNVSTPAFSWPATEEKHVACAVFSERIQVDQDEIANPESVVWIWHSGLGRGREGNVLFEHGVSEPGSRAPASPLSPTKTYYWAVWALDLAGYPVASTVEQSFKVP
jgi:hypothetical protein